MRFGTAFRICAINDESVMDVSGIAMDSGYWFGLILSMEREGQGGEACQCEMDVRSVYAFVTKERLLSSI